MLVVIQPAALEYASDELHKIEQYVSRKYLVRMGIPEVAATVDDVARHLLGASIAHFACHGSQNRMNPLDSALVLEDGPLPISRIMKTSMPNASLAFLCACETAMGDANVPDEAMHLAGTMLYAGFRGAVATMW
jgi:CHAT domain-containing protein